MEAKVRVDGELLEAIEVKNGLRQGYMMAPIQFNLFASVMCEKRTEAVQGVEGVGEKLVYKLDQQLFKRSTRG